jgi:hypothetical protein
MVDKSLIGETLSRILERLKEFKVEQKLSKFQFGDESGDATDQLLAVLSLCKHTPSIVSLDLGWPTRNLTSLKAILSKFPSLTKLRMPLYRAHIDLIDLFSGYKSLECVEGLSNTPGTDSWFKFCFDWIAAMSHTKLGMNISCSIRRGVPTREAESSLLLMALLEHRPHDDAVQNLTNLAAALKQKIPAQDLVTLITKYVFFKRENLKELLEFLVSPTRSAAFLPPPQELVHLLRNRFPLWKNMVALCRVPTVELFVRLVGPPEVEPFELFCTALHQVGFDPAIMVAFEDIEVGELSEPLIIKCFEPVRSSAALRWLLNHFAKERGPQVLAQSLPSGAWSKLMLHYLRVAATDVSKALDQYFGDASNGPYSFPTDEEFELFAKICLWPANLAALQRAVQCAGPDGISPASRARVLLFCFTDTNISANLQVLDYWLSVVFEGPEPDFMAPAWPALEQRRSVLIKLLTLPRLKEFYPVLAIFKDTMIRQLLLAGIDEIRWLIEYVLNYVCLIQKTDTLFAGSFDSYRGFLEEIFRLWSSTGHSTAAILLSYRFLAPDASSVTDTVVELFDIAYRLDFSSENERNHARCVAEMIEQTSHNFFMYRNFDNLIALVLLWIGYVQEASQPQNTYIAHLISAIYDRISEARNANDVVEDIELVLERLVRCDGRPLETILQEYGSEASNASNL